jgi:hypothetical protein
MRRAESDFWVAMTVGILFLLLMSFDAGRILERKRVHECPKRQGGIAATQTIKSNGDVICAYVRHVSGLAMEVTRLP